VLAKLTRWAEQAAEKTFYLHRLNIGPRLTFCFALIILAMLVGNVVLLWQFHQILAQADRRSGVDQELIAVLQIHTSLISFCERMDGLAQSENSAGLVREAQALRNALLENTQRSRNALSRLPPEVQLDPTLLPTLKAIESTLPEQLEAITALAKSGDWEAVRLRLANQVRPAESQTTALVQNVDREVSEQRAQAVLNMRQAQQRILFIVPITAVLTLLIAAFLGWAIRHSITQPLRRLIEGSKALARGEFEHRVAIAGDDELARLGRVFNDTAGRLRDLYATLQASEDRLRLVTKTIPAHVWSALPDGSVDFIGDRWVESTGLSVKEGLGWGWGSVFHPDDLARFAEEWRAARATGEPMESEARQRTSDGEYRWRMIRNVPLRDKLGNIVKWYGTSIDIEDRKRAEDALRRSRAYLTEAQTLSHTGSFGLSVSTGEVFWSDETFRVFECDPASFRPSVDSIIERIHPEDIDRVRQEFEQAAKGGTGVDLEHRLRMPDGSIKYVHIFAHGARDSSGQLELVGAVMDVTDRKRAESLLAGEKRILEMVAKGESLAQILDSLCRIVEEQASEVLASILLLDGDRLRHGGAPSLPKAYTDVIDGAAIGPSEGSCGTAAYRGKQVIVEDIATDPLWANYRNLALPYSLRACWSTPIFSSKGKVIATFAMYYREPRRPGPRDQETIEQITHLAGVAIERKLAEDALRRSEAYLAESQRLTQTGSWALNPATGGTVYCSPEMFRIFGFDPLQGLPALDSFRQRVHPEDRLRVIGSFDKVAREKADFVEDQRIVLPDGQVRHIHITGHPVLAKTGELVEYVGTAIDVTDRKRAEEGLRAAETRFRTFVDHATDALFVDDEQGRIIDVNRRACESLGYTRDELIGMAPRKFDLALNEAFRQSVNKQLASGETIAFETSYRRKDGTEFPVELRVRPFWHGGHQFSLALARDITERRRAEEERERLRQAQAALERVTRVSTMGELTASLAHEVNQPIAAAITNSNTCLRWLQRDPPDLEEARQAASRSVKDATRAADIISRVRSLFKKGSPQGLPVDVNEVIREMIVLMRRQTERHSVAIRTDLAADLPKALADRVQLQQVLTNLMLNGIEAMKDVTAERELTIHSGLGENNHLLISVSDTGVGLAPQQADQIFNPFFTTKPEGTGLGLAISRSIIEAHGGRLWADATSGRGAIFHFTLPRPSENAE